MKLAEALQLRADLNKRISQLKERLIINAKVQEGESPSENPESLLEELERNCKQLESIICQINRTNSWTQAGDGSISDLIAKRDALALKISILRDFTTAASVKIARHTRQEIKILSTVNVVELQKQLDHLSEHYRHLDTQLQELNWTTELLQS